MKAMKKKQKTSHGNMKITSALGAKQTMRVRPEEETAKAKSKRAMHTVPAPEGPKSKSGRAMHTVSAPEGPKSKSGRAMRTNGDHRAFPLYLGM